MRVMIVAFGSHGDILPFIALGTELKRRGHAVILAVPPGFDSLTGKAGLDVRQLGEEADFENVHANAELWDAKNGLRIMFELAVRLAEAAYALVEAESAKARSNAEPFLAVASTLSFGPRLAQERLGLRAVTAHLAPYPIRSRTVPPVLPGLTLPSWLPPMLTHAVQRLADRFVVDPMRLPPLNALRARLGLPAITRFTDWLQSPDGVLLMVPDWFAPPQADWPAPLVQTGFPRGDRFGDTTELGDDAHAFLEAGENPIAVTFGSSMRHGRDFFDTAVTACATLRRRAILVTGKSEQIPASLPEGMLHLSYAPFSTLLPHCAGLIHHGGIGTVAEALAAGIPQLIVPNAFDQFDNAARITRLGVGRALPRGDLTRQRLADAISELLTSSAVAAACAQAKAAMAREDGIAAACDALERFAEAGETTDAGSR